MQGNDKNSDIKISDLLKTFKNKTILNKKKETISIEE